MSKLKIHIRGHGAIEVYRIKGVNKKIFDQTVTDAVVNTLELMEYRPHGFHPALGVDGYHWDHENQRRLPDVVIPEVFVKDPIHIRVWARMKNLFKKKEV